ncbi:hypothetical protein SK128_010244, partial [Halocaridina rubra]
ERQTRLDEFLELLLSLAKEEAPISNLIHFSDVASVVNLLSSQFLADIEHICLGSASYESDVSSSATSRSVESIVSDASQTSDTGKGCRPRITGKYSHTPRRTVSLKETTSASVEKLDRHARSQAELQECYEDFNRELAEFSLQSLESIKAQFSLNNARGRNSAVFPYDSGSARNVVVHSIRSGSGRGTEMRLCKSSSNASDSAESHDICPRSVPCSLKNERAIQSDFLHKINISTPNLANIPKRKSPNSADTVGVFTRINCSAPDLDFAHRNSNSPNLDLSHKINASAPNLEAAKTIDNSVLITSDVNRNTNFSAPNSLHDMIPVNSITDDANNINKRLLSVTSNTSNIFHQNGNIPESSVFSSEDDRAHSLANGNSLHANTPVCDIIGNNCDSAHLSSEVSSKGSLKDKDTHDRNSYNERLADDICVSNLERVAPQPTGVSFHNSDVEMSKSDCVPIDAVPPLIKKIRHQSTGSMPHSSPRSRQLSAHISLGQDDGVDAVALKHYVLRGCGAKILISLDQLGVSSLTGTKEISHVLGFVFRYIFKNAFGDDRSRFWCDSSKSKTLFQEKRICEEKSQNYAKDTNQSNELSKGNQKESTTPSKKSFKFKYEPAVSLTLKSIFGSILHPSQFRNGSASSRNSMCFPMLWSQTSGSKSSSLSSCQSVKKVGKRRKKRPSMTCQYIPSESDGEDPINYGRIRKSMVKFTMNPKDFEYFTSIVYSDNDRYLEAETDQSSSRVSGKVYCHDNAICLSVVELLQCILSLQAQLAAHEAETKQVFSPLLTCTEILIFCLDVIPAIVEEMKNLERKREESFHIYVLLTQILRLLFSSSHKFLKNSEWLNTVIDHKVVPKVLDLVSDLIDSKAEVGKVLIGKMTVAYEAILGLIFTLQCCTCLRAEYKEVRHCLSLHKLFLEHDGPRAVAVLVSLSSSLPFGKRGEILCSLSKLVVYMKYWREDVHHSEKCEKKSHRFCEYVSIQNHHLQVFGMSSSLANSIDPSTCMVGNFVAILIDCLSGTLEPELYRCGIKALSKCGLCCCMNVGMILSNMLQLVMENPSLVTSTTAYIEDIVWRDLSGIVSRDTPRCAFCLNHDYLGGVKYKLTGEYTLDESFSSTFSERCASLFHNPPQYISEGNNEVDQPSSVSRWEGISLYRKYFLCRDIGSKIVTHVIRLLSHSNTNVKLEMCEHLIVPTLKQICDQGIGVHLENKALETEVLLGLFKCFRLTIAESNDQKLMKFLQEHGLALVTSSKCVPGIRHEAFALLCNIVMKELKSKPGLPVVSDADEESSFVFTKVFESEILEHDEFWTGYFNMKDREVKERFFIHTQFSMDRGENPRSGSHERVNSGDDEGCKIQPDVDMPAYTVPSKAHEQSGTDLSDDDEPVYVGRMVRQNAIDEGRSGRESDSSPSVRQLQPGEKSTDHDTGDIFK